MFVCVLALILAHFKQCAGDTTVKCDGPKSNRLFQRSRIQRYALRKIGPGPTFTTIGTNGNRCYSLVIWTPEKAHTGWRQDTKRFTPLFTLEWSTDCGRFLHPWKERCQLDDRTDYKFPYLAHFVIHTRSWIDYDVFPPLETVRIGAWGLTPIEIGFDKLTAVIDNAAPLHPESWGTHLGNKCRLFREGRGAMMKWVSMEVSDVIWERRTLRTQLSAMIPTTP